MRKKLPPVEYLRECFDYNPETGVLTWKHRPRGHFETTREFINWNRKYDGKRAGRKSFGSRFYRHVSIDGTSYTEHRLIWFYCHGVRPVHEIDHINRCRSDNRICNLRDVTSSENNRNRILPTMDKASLFVEKAGDCFLVKAPLTDGRVVNLEKFETELEAFEFKLQFSKVQLPRINRSGIIGVDKKNHGRRRWRAVIQVNSRQRHLGYFDTIEEAARARWIADRYYDNRQRTNWSPDKELLTWWNQVMTGIARGVRESGRDAMIEFGFPTHLVDEASQELEEAA